MYREPVRATSGGVGIPGEPSEMEILRPTDSTWVGLYQVIQNPFYMGSSSRNTYGFLP